ncbi:MAG: DUF4037 domain-containing protein [Chloroflexota bacterium]
MNKSFINGLDLAELFYHEAVKPVLDKHYPDLPHSAALIGMGSEVMDFDTEQSTDHDWGPRLLLFLDSADHGTYQSALNNRLRHELPTEVRGYATSFTPNEDGTGRMDITEGAEIEHRVMILTVQGLFRYVLNFDPTDTITAVDWVSVSDYDLLMLTSGRVFHDGLGQLNPLRTKLRYYPDDVWLYLLAAQWKRIAQEEAFMGRCGQVGDELGSRLVASRLVRDLMRLCFLMERHYAPYIKWFGSAFAQLDSADRLAPVLTDILSANTWQERQTHLSLAYAFVAQMHNNLGITKPLSAQVSQFHNRPFWVIHADRFVDEIRACIHDEAVLALPEHLGSIDQFVDSTDAMNMSARFRPVYLPNLLD